MKKVNVFLFVLMAVFAINHRANAQTYSSFQEKFNLVGFGGHEVQQKNTGVNNQYAGLYIDWLILKNQHWMLGPYVIADVSRAEDNMAWFTGRGYELGAGATLGYFSWDFSLSHKLYTSLSAGIKFNNSTGESEHRGNYRETQRDILFAANFDFDLMKKQNIAFLPRTQLITSFQAPLNTEKEAYWNDAPIPTTPWNKSDFKLVGKQSVTSWRFGGWQTCTALKLIGLYEYTQSQSLWGLGAEISEFKLDKDDFVLVNCLYRWHPEYLKNDLVFQVVVNFTAF